MARYRECRNAFEFAADLERAAEVLGVGFAKEATVEIALQLHRKIVLGTPVDTGRARANWQISESAPELGVILGRDLAPIPKLSGDTTIYITNSLPYIVPLEYGHSKQAPHGMVRKAIAEVASSVI